MANLITRNDPFVELGHEFEGMFGLPRLRKWIGEYPADPTMKLDVTEDDKAFHVKADLPGVKKEDIEIEVEGRQVSVSAEVKRESEEKKGETVLRSERYYGKQFRSFVLDHDIVRDAVEAKFADGVLDITLPKANGKGTQRIAVQ